MDIFALLNMAGGLALFLYGLDTISRGLSAYSGNRIQVLLRKCTKNKMTAVISGGLATAIVSSSSSVTVMIAGLVDAGVLNLSRSVGLVMGANIGTTATAWILAGMGLPGYSLFTKMLRPSFFCPLLAVAGILLLLGKNEEKTAVGNAFMGFAILMTGMETMCQAAGPLASDPLSLKLLGMADNPVTGLIAGAAFTALLQSSSASVGMLQVLCRSGVFTYETAIPIILGQNIGTCITAILAGIHASKGARRVAAIHLYFNLIGSTCFLLLLLLAKHILPLSILAHPASPVSIAALHTLYNILTTIIIYPHSDKLEKLAVFTVRH